MLLDPVEGGDLGDEGAVVFAGGEAAQGFLLGVDGHELGTEALLRGEVFQDVAVHDEDGFAGQILEVGGHGRAGAHGDGMLDEGMGL